MRPVPVPAAGAFAAAAVAAVLVTLATPAQAGPPEHAKAHGVVSHKTGADTRAEQRAVRAYWTKERMRNAKPRDVIRPTGKPQGTGKPSKGGSTPDAALGSPWPSEQKTVGKVFFTLGGSNYVCSGNVVDWNGDVVGGAPVDTENVVSTAGHCVSDGGSIVATNFMFVPAYDGTKSGAAARPYGSFVASSTHTSNEWAAQGADKWDYDVGFARMQPLDGKTLEAAVGSTDISFGAEPGSPSTSYSLVVHSFGYPAARPYNGTKLISCWGTTRRDTYGGSGDYRLPCNMTGGSSGGPWLLDADGGVATVQVSVNSFGYTGEKNAMYGPVLGSTAQQVYSAAAAAN